MKTPKLLFALSFAALTALPGLALESATPAASTEAPTVPPAATEAPAPAARRAGKKAATRPAQAIRAIDKDGDHKLDAKEIEELTRQFDADPKGPLGRFDMNANGKLERDEIKRITDRMAKREGKGKGRGQGKRKAR